MAGAAHMMKAAAPTPAQSAACFAQWLLTELAALYPDFTPPDPKAWANVGWSGDEHFVGC
ncbi:MAG TPA: hypothetical protein VKZ65_02105 [Glycomyces sp.]|nr:hypothetical protein [Glycomyces sp.]